MTVTIEEMRERRAGSDVCYPGCPCDDCERIRKIARRRSKLNRMGVSATVDVAPVRRHVDNLVAAGMLPQHIAREAGIGPATLSEIRNRRRDRIKRETAAAVLSVRPTLGPTVPKLGTVRRARALMALGWTFYEIERRAGLSRGYLRLISERDQDRVMTWAALAVAEVYEELSMQVGPSGRQRAFARNRGYLPPLAWDDIDDPNEHPILGRDPLQYRSEDLLAEWHFLRGAGVSIHAAASQLGVSVGAIEKAIERVGKVGGMKVSGWCSAPEGARPMCGGCKVLDCEHECHGRPVVERDSRTTSVAFGAESRDNMSTASTANEAARATAAKRFPGPTITDLGVTA